MLAIWHMLRLGTAPLNDYLQTINCHDTGTCACGQAPETVEHFLMECEQYSSERCILDAEFHKAAPSIINPSIHHLLGNPTNLSRAAVDSIFAAVTKYIRQTRRFKRNSPADWEPPD